MAFVVEPDGDETEVRASLRVEADGWWGGDLIGPADWIGLTESTEPFVKPAATRRAVGRVLRGTEAVADACREAVRSLGDQLSAVQSVNANVCHLVGLDR